ncbi:MAG: sugar phosphate isomerase/epimerase [Acidobacteria bacterium]|nr:sugar phosphate isomerase/epimerase [Acidobacteriota bacterium]
MLSMTRREWHTLVGGSLIAAPLARMTDLSARASTIAGVGIGAQTYSFRDRPLDDAIAAMKQVGIGYCELWSDHVETKEAIGGPTEGAGRREAQRVWRLKVPLDVFHEVRSKFDRAGIVLTAYNLSFKDDFSNEEIERGFEMARALGVPVITASGNVTTAARVDPVAQRYGIKVGFHNHSDIKPNEFATPDDFAEPPRSNRVVAHQGPEAQPGRQRAVRRGRHADQGRAPASAGSQMADPGEHRI